VNAGLVGLILITMGHMIIAIYPPLGKISRKIFLLHGKNAQIISHQNAQRIFLLHEKKRSEDISPPRKKSSGDISPPRKKSSGDISPPRKKSSGDISPPRKKSSGDISPPRKKSSPPRKKSSGDISPPRKNRSEDISPPRKKRSADNQLEDIDISPPRKKSGLLTAEEVEKQSQDKLLKEKFARENMDATAAGKGAQTIYRDKRGRPLTMLNTLVNNKQDETLQYKWGGAETKDDEDKKRIEEEEKGKPYRGTTIDDEKLNEEYRNAHTTWPRVGWH